LTFESLTFEKRMRVAMFEESNDWKLVKRRRPSAAAPTQLQLDDQERQRALARRSAAKLVAKRSAKLKARELHEDELRADKEDGLRLGRELQRAELEQQVQRGEARRRLDDVQQKADQGRAQRRITANANARRIPSIFAGASRCCSRTSPSTISPT